jgi:hypothetical protein
MCAAAHFRQVISVGIETRLRDGRPRNCGSILDRTKRFPVPHSVPTVQTDSGAHTTGRCFTLSERKADLLPPSTTKLRNMCSYNSTTPHTSIKQIESFTFFSSYLYHDFCMFLLRTTKATGLISISRRIVEYDFVYFTDKSIRQ